VSFAIGESSKVITIDVAGDTSVETDEGFTVSLSNASAGLVLGTGTATGTIVNDDLANVPTSGADTLTGTPQSDTLDGLGGDDSLMGLAGDDVLYGGAGADTLTGGAGNDTLDGGADTDLAVFSGTQSAYRFAFDGSLLIVTGPDGTDRLSNIEELRFNSGNDISINSLIGTGTIEEVMSVQTAGVTTKIIPSIYSGPVSWIKYEMLGNTTSNVIVGTSKNDFINLMGGDDAANGGAGDDVLDGGTGSNFLSGGAGRDDFFLDGRGGTTTWATITDWQSGERLSVWGWRPGVSKAAWVESAGAPGWTGVTMHGDLDGNGAIDTSVTWTGLSRQQLPTPLEYDGLLWFT
jgi:serralysin